MDNLMVELIGKPKLNPKSKIITVVAENFSMTEDQSKFLKATLAIPTEKQLPLNNVRKQLVQVGRLHNEIKDQLEKADWTVILCEDGSTNHPNESITTKLDNTITSTGDRSLIFVNDASRMQLLLGNDKKELRNFLRLVDKWKRQDNHFVVVLYQQSQPISTVTFLRDLEFISDASIRNKACKNCYLQTMWFQPNPTIKTLIPPKIESSYYTCKVGKSYWSSDLLCFYERTQVTKNYDPDSKDGLQSKLPEPKSNNKSDANEKKEDSPESALQKIGLNDDEDGPNQSNFQQTLPYIRAQNPEQSRIFYYPDKDDDVDEDDPDDDLGI